MRKKAGILGLAILLALSGWAIAAGEELRDVHQVVTINSDGGILIEESWTAVADAPFDHVHNCLSSGDVNETVTFIGPGPEAPDNQELEAVYDDERDCLLVMVQASTMTTSLRLSYVYRVDGAVKAYGDVVHWSKDMRPVDAVDIHGYSLTLTVPGVIESPYLTGVRKIVLRNLGATEPPPEAYESLEGAEGTSTRYHLELERIPARQPVTVDVLLPPESFSMEGQGEQLYYFLGQMGPVPYPLNPDFQLGTGSTRLSDAACRERIGNLVVMLESSLFQATSPPICYLAPATNPLRFHMAIRQAASRAHYSSESTQMGTLMPGVFYERYDHAWMGHYLFIVNVSKDDESLWLISMGLKY